MWLPEHHFEVYGMLVNPMTLAIAISHRTRRLKIGTAIKVLPFRHPLRVAEDAALVDNLSGGRLLPGLGRRYQPPEFHGFGPPQENSWYMNPPRFFLSPSRCPLTFVLCGDQPKHL